MHIKLKPCLCIHINAFEHMKSSVQRTQLACWSHSFMADIILLSPLREPPLIVCSQTSTGLMLHTLPSPWQPFQIPSVFSSPSASSVIHSMTLSLATTTSVLAPTGDFPGRCPGQIPLSQNHPVEPKPQRLQYNTINSTGAFLAPGNVLSLSALVPSWYSGFLSLCRLG